MRKSDSPNMRVSLKILMGLFSVNEKKKSLLACLYSDQFQVKL